MGFRNDCRREDTRSARIRQSYCKKTVTNATTKTDARNEDKKGEKIQGKGWEVHEPEKSIEENLKLFGYIHELYKLDHPEPKASNEQLPTEVQIVPTV
jgi:hypothetical protein